MRSFNSFHRCLLTATAFCLIGFALIAIYLPGVMPRVAASHVSTNAAMGATASRAAHAARALDANDLLVLHFDNSLTGENGEIPAQSSGVTFAPGVSGQGVQVDSGDLLKYATTGNFNAPAGSIEFWIKPMWNGSDTTTRSFFSVGNNQLLLVKDGGNN